MERIARRVADPIAVCLVAAVAALAALAGCSGHTTGASQITRQPDGTFSAELNVVGSCDKGSPSTPCTAYTQWRKVGTSDWTKGRTATVPKVVKDVHRSQTAAELANNTTYEYQLCGKEFTDKDVKCVGPGQDESTDQFVIGRGSTTGGGGNGSALVPFLIAVAAGALILGGVWWASRRFSG